MPVLFIVDFTNAMLREITIIKTNKHRISYEYFNYSKSSCVTTNKNTPIFRGKIIVAQGLEESVVEYRYI